MLGILLTIPATLSLSAAETDIQWPIGDKTYEISIGAQVKTEAELQDGGFYVIYQPRNNCCIEEAADHKLMLNGLAYNALNGTTNTSYVLRLLKNNDGTWRIQTASGRYFPVPTGNQNLYSAEKAGNYSPNFNADGYIFPRITASGTTYGLDRASSGVYSYSTLNNTVGSAQCYQIFAVNLNEPNVIVHQGYQTVGRNSAKALLLRINIPGNNKNTTIDKICVTLKGNTLANVSQLQVYQTDNQEFYADNAPRLIGEASTHELVHAAGADDHGLKHHHQDGEDDGDGDGQREVFLLGFGGSTRGDGGAGAAHRGGRSQRDNQGFVVNLQHLGAKPPHEDDDDRRYNPSNAETIETELGDVAEQH